MRGLRRQEMTDDLMWLSMYYIESCPKTFNCHNKIPSVIPSMQ